MSSKKSMGGSELSNGTTPDAKKILRELLPARESIECQNGFEKISGSAAGIVLTCIYAGSSDRNVFDCLLRQKRAASCRRADEAGEADFWTRREEKLTLKKI